MNKKENPQLFNFGDEDFTRKLFIYYSWSAPVILFLLSILFFKEKALITGFIILFLSIFLIPIDKISKKISKSLRILIVLGLIVLAVYSTYFYA